MKKDIYNKFIEVYEKGGQSDDDRPPSFEMLVYISTLMKKMGTSELLISASFPPFIGAPEELPEDVYAVKLFFSEDDAMAHAKTSPSGRALTRDFLDPLVFHESHIRKVLSEYKKILVPFCKTKNDAEILACHFMAALIYHAEWMREECIQGCVSSVIGTDKSSGENFSLYIHFGASASWSERLYVDKSLGLTICSDLHQYLEQVDSQGGFDIDSMKSFVTMLRPLSSVAPEHFADGGLVDFVITKVEIADPDDIFDIDVEDLSELVSSIQSSIEAPGRARYKH